MPLNGEQQREIAEIAPRANTDTDADTRRQLLALRELLETRLGGMDRATELLAKTVDKVPSETDKAIEHLQSLHEEKFGSIQTQFRERDTRAERESRDNKIAVDAAFAAAKEAVAAQNIANNESIAKSEASVTKQIDGAVALIASNGKATDDKINDIKEQLAQRNGIGQQMREQRQGNQFNIGTAIAVLAALGGYILIAVLLLTGKG